MTVPTPRLIFAALALLLPALTITSAGGAASSLGAGGVLFLLCVAAADARRARSRAPNFEIDAPALLRSVQARAVECQLRLSRQTSTVRTTWALETSPEISVAPQQLSLQLAAGTSQTLPFRLSSNLRGKHHVLKLWIQYMSPLGLWEHRRSRVLNQTLRVYPDLMREQKLLATLFSSHRLGAHRVPQLGQGHEFDRLREYLPGDPYDHIHWKATAKRGRPVTKLFQVERSQHVYVAIDASRLSGRPVPREPNGGDSSDGTVPASSEEQLEPYLRIALLLGAAAEQLGDAFGVLGFNDQVRHFVKASVGRANRRACREVAADISQRPVNPDYGELFSFIRQRVKRRSLIIVLTSLDDAALAEEFRESVRLVSDQHIVLVASLRPDGECQIFSGEDANTTSDLYERLASHLTWKQGKHLAFCEKM